MIDIVVWISSGFLTNIERKRVDSFVDIAVASPRFGFYR